MLSVNEALLSALLHGSSDLVFLTDTENCLIRAGNAFLDFIGSEEEDVMATPCHELLMLDGMSEIEQVLQSAASWHGEGLLRDRYRNTVQHKVQLQQIESDEGRVRLWILCSAQPTAGALPKQLQYDALTGLPNTSLFIDRAEQAILNTRRNGQTLAIMSLGIDGFSRINDGLGHAFGDRLLKEVGERLRQTLRTSDSVARVGGDQFLCAVNMRTGDDSMVVTEKLLQALKAPFLFDAQEINLTAAIGVTISPSDGENADSLIKQAESAMRHCKRTGGDSYQFFSPTMHERARRRIELENALRCALDNDEFVLHYQPKVDVDSGCIVGAEALVRWQHPERGMIPPGEFIPVAEESGLIGAIGAWVTREACRQNRAWLDSGLVAVGVSVNMAAPQFRERDIVEQIESILIETGLPAEYLEIEITEGLLIGDIDAIEEKLRGFRQLGLKIAIDDFGTGYSSLSYLSRFPITTLKIDRAFVHDLEHNHSTAEIARAIIGLSRGLELEVVAEGAETAEHINFLTEHGCATVQGFFYSRPLPAEEFEQMLRRGVIR